jgi:ATP-dependent Clp protease ATP-binding subunit ClpC
MFERFTERARQVVVFAQDEARFFKHNYIGTEHLLLGLLREEEGIAARALAALDITIEEVRAALTGIVGQGDEITTGQIPFTPRTKKVLELALREALALGHNHVGTEHVLLGLAREGRGVAMRILLDFGVDGERIRSEISRLLGGTTIPPIERVLGASKSVWADRSPPMRPLWSPFLLGWLLFGVALGLGVLVGWAIWGLA